jgi:hypothetical protein
LFQSPIYYALCTSQKDYEKELKRIGINPQPGITGSQGATLNMMTSKDGKECAIICIFNHTLDYEQIASMLAHEAVHLFQEIKENIGERNPSAEFEAYCIQCITQNLLYAYKKQVRRKSKK